MSELVTLAPDIVEMRALPVYEEPTGMSDADAWEKYANDWRLVHTSAQAHMFMLGAIADSLTRRYGERSVQRFASQVKCSASLIYERAATYRMWRGKTIDPEADYHMHKQAGRMARLTGRDPVEVLADFEDSKLSTRQAEAEIKAVQGKTLDPYTPEPYPLPTPEVYKRLDRWKGHVRAQPCIVCQSRQNVHYAHFKALVNSKTGEMELRHQGLSDWLGMPLCERHHMSDNRSIHSIGEQRFIAEQFGGLDVLMGMWARMLLDWVSRWE
jgi:hypothetical protein